jgi:hypothetical protein
MCVFANQYFEYENSMKDENVSDMIGIGDGFLLGQGMA